MTQQAQLNKQGRQYIIDLAHIVHDLWGKMCQEAGIPEDSKFVDTECFKGSKYLQFYNNAINQYFEAKHQYASGGYVGLKIQGGKAR